MYADIEKLYIDLHRNPELSMLEEKTAAKLAERMRKLGYEVTTKVGGTGVVAMLRNGTGPTLMIRADMDALPVLEQTGLPYASKVTMKDAVTGETVPVMHACGHDVHMAAWIGTATILARRRELWHGTVMFVGQPAEERIRGAKAMLADGLYTRFGKPDMALGDSRSRHDAGRHGGGDAGLHHGECGFGRRHLPRHRRPRRLSAHHRGSRAHGGAFRGLDPDAGRRARTIHSIRPSSRWARSRPARSTTSFPTSRSCS